MVRRFGSPASAEFLDMSKRNRSPVSTAIERRKTSARPSGATAGSESPHDPVGGEVSLCFSPVSTDKRNTALGSLLASWSTTASPLLSGNQERLPPSYAWPCW